VAILFHMSKNHRHKQKSRQELHQHEARNDIPYTRSAQLNAVVAAPTQRHWRLRLVLYVTTVLAIAVPFCIAYQLPPQPAFVSQAAALALWLLVISCLALLPANAASPTYNERGAIALWLLLIAAILASVLAQRTPMFVAAPTLAVLVVVTLVAMLAARVPYAWRNGWFVAICVGVLFAALYNSGVAVLQTYAPHWYDNVFIASRHDERAYGNLRQPNQLATLVLWGMLAAIALMRGLRWSMIATIALLLATLLFTGSRAGLLGLLVVAAVGLLSSSSQQRFSRRTVAIVSIAFLLTSAAVIFALLWFTQMREASLSSTMQRLSLWRDVVTLIGSEPLFGVGFGQLNFAWTLTPLVERTPDVFDHAHSLPLQLAVEFGIPFATIFLLLLGGLLVRGFSSSERRRQWIALGMLGVVLMHSLFEYPLWFAYFLMPTALLLTVYVQPTSATSPQQSSTPPSTLTMWRARWPLAMVALCFAGLASTISGYLRVTNIYKNASDPARASSFAQQAQTHWLYGYYGDYAAIMLAGDNANLNDFSRPTRAIIDERLLAAWARALAREGRIAESTFIVERAREFATHPSFANLPTAGIRSGPRASAPKDPAQSRGSADFRR
jgi:O-antigen ligase